MDNNFYVYVYLDAEVSGKFEYEKICFLYEPIYIGKGKKDRFLSHIKECHKEKYSFHKKLKYLLYSDCKNPICFKIEEYLTENKAFELEKYYINIIGRRVNNKGPLYNIGVGGKGGDNWTALPNKEQVIKKWRNTYNKNKHNHKRCPWKIKRNPDKIRRGFHHTEETKNKLRGPRGKYNISEEELKRRRDIKLGTKDPPELKLKKKNKIREALSKPETKNKIIKRSKERNTSAALYEIETLNKIYKVQGYMNLLHLHNTLFPDYIKKDGGYFVNQLKNNKISYMRLKSITRINQKNKTGEIYNEY